MNINLRIIISLIIAFIVVNFYGRISKTPFISSAQAENIKNILSNLRFPTYDLKKLFTLKFNQTNDKVLDKNSYFNLPTAPITPTTSNLTYFQPSPTLYKKPYPTVYPTDSVIETFIQKSTQNPTSTPKPTKKPKPSPTPLAPPEYLRPGTGLDDIFKKAGELACVPQALLKAFVAQEAPGVLNWTDQQALFYNTYDWWHRVKTLKEVCAGYGWYPETGLVAEDSLFANERCKEPFSAETANDTYSKSLGATMMLKYYWDKYYASSTKQKLKVTKVDRRVLIDSLIGFGIHLRQDSGYTGRCDNWDLKSIAKAACVNTGISCEVYNYCYTICNNYNKYSGKSNNCNNVTSYFVSGTCTFK